VPILHHVIVRPHLARPVRRVCGFSTRVLLLVLGSLTIAVSVAVTLWTGLGPGPLDVFIGAVRTHTGVPLSVAVWMVVGSLIAVAWLLGRRPGFGTLAGPLVVGVVMQSTLSVLEQFEAPDALVARMVIQLLAIGAIGVGAGALIVSRLGAGSGELLTSAASGRTGHPERWVRLALEVSWLLIGVALGGPAGLGTVMIALTLGLSVSNGQRMVDHGVGRLRDASVLLVPLPAEPELPAPALLAAAA
jgi:uncharacterized membrane protein YczE